MGNAARKNEEHRTQFETQLEKLPVKKPEVGLSSMVVGAIAMGCLLGFAAIYYPKIFGAVSGLVVLASVVGIFQKDVGTKKRLEAGVVGIPGLIGLSFALFWPNSIPTADVPATVAQPPAFSDQPPESKVVAPSEHQAMVQKVSTVEVNPENPKGRTREPVAYAQLIKGLLRKDLPRVDVFLKVDGSVRWLFVHLPQTDWEEIEPQGKLALLKILTDHMKETHGRGDDSARYVGIEITIGDKNMDFARSSWGVTADQPTISIIRE